MKKFILLLTLIILLAGKGFSQEAGNCADNIDNDNDFATDCWDINDCGASVPCKDFFLGHDATCQTPPVANPQFQMIQMSQSDDQTASTNSNIVIGDVDQDGIPEIISFNPVNNFNGTNATPLIYVLRGTDLGTIRAISPGVSPGGINFQLHESNTPIVADVNGDGCAEIFIGAIERAQYFPGGSGPSNASIEANSWILAFNGCTGARIWATKTTGFPGAIGVADFNGDGTPEIYAKNTIFNAVTGAVLNADAASVLLRNDTDNVDVGPVAVDILPTGPTALCPTCAVCPTCDGLELVSGGKIYAINNTTFVTSIAKDINTIIPLAANKYFVKVEPGIGFPESSMTSVADFNLDGRIDVLMNGCIRDANGGTHPLSSGASGISVVWFWDVYNNIARNYIPVQTTGRSWHRGTGRINIADVDGDGRLNATFESGNRLFCLRDDFTTLQWPPVTFIEGSSGYTTTSVFDFNKDGASEIVYRDEQKLHIIRGTDGTPYPLAPPCLSATRIEYPLIADVDGDGSTEICVPCHSAPLATGSASTNESIRRSGHIRKFESAIEPWVPARPLWNQHGYFSVNVDDDLTIPSVQLSQLTNLSSSAPCSTGPNIVFNKFLNQSPFLDSRGCPQFAAIDIAFDPATAFTITPPTCPNTDFTVTFAMKNLGSLGFSGTVPITFYNGDPFSASAVKLQTNSVNVSNFEPNVVIPVTMTVTGTGGTFNLHAVLSDAGTSPTFPIVLPNTGYIECLVNNNRASAAVNPVAFPLTGVTTNNFTCSSGTTVPNGSARVYKLEGATQVTAGYTFYWYNGAVAGAPAAAVYNAGPIYSPIAGGQYTVFAVNNAAQCNSAPITLTVADAPRTLTAVINVNNVFSDCRNPNGRLTVIMNGGDPPGDYTYQWQEATLFPVGSVLSTSHVLTGARALDYTVEVTEKATGCTIQATQQVPSSVPTIVMAATITPAVCVPSNSGSASATADGGTAGFTFDWYNGTAVLPIANATGATYSLIPAGSYTVVATRNSTGCSSNPFIVVVGSTLLAQVSTIIVAPQTSCNPNTPNGRASANIGGITAGYTFRWFVGNNTLAANLLPNAAVPTAVGATTASISGLSANVYTVEATNTLTGCIDTEIVTIVNNLVTPTVSATKVDQTNCSPANGSVAATAAISTGPHQFYWFNGNIGTPDTTAFSFKGTPYTTRPAGDYTVVAVDRITRCVSARQVVAVINNTVLPTITPTITHQTSCNLASPTGQISASAAPAGTYKFRWWSGADTTIVANFILQGSSISGRAAGTYLVKAVNTGTGCSSTLIVTINDARVLPLISLVKTDNTMCAPVTSFNGTVTASVTNLGANVIGNYSFAFGGGQNVGTTTGNVYSVLNGGPAAYTVTATHTASGCVSAQSTIVVNNNQDLPDLTTANTGSTNCTVGLENGRARVVTVDGNPASILGFTYAWTGPVAPPFSVAANTTNDDIELQNVRGGAGYDYTVLVTNTTNGCTRTAIVNVADLRVLPLITLAKTDNTICAPAASFNGSVTASVTNIPVTGTIADYTFNFGGGQNIGTITGNVYSILNGGPTAYTVTTTQTATGCASAQGTIVVNNNQDLPDLTTANTGSTNCTVGLENGRARVVTVDGNPASIVGFTYAWTGPVAPPFSVAANTTNDDIELQNVRGGAGYDYTVLVTNTTNGCTRTAIVNVADLKVLPLLTLAKTDNTICAPAASFDGSVTASVTNIPGGGTIADYSFSFGGGQSAGVTTGNVFSVLNGGAAAYTVTATQTATGCVSAQGTIVVNNNQNIPDLTTGTTASTNCAAGLENGIAQVATVDGGAPTIIGFTYAWTGPVAPAFSVAANATNDDIILQNLRGGAGYNYTVLVTNTANGCTSTAIVSVADAKVIPLVTLAQTENTICDPAFTPAVGDTFNGVVTATVTNLVGALTDYTFAFAGGAGTQGASPAHNTFNELNGGISYTAIATHTATGCVSASANRLVVNNLFIPPVNVAITPQTSCNAATPNGILAATINETALGGGAAVTAGYSFSWVDDVTSLAVTSAGGITSSTTPGPGLIGNQNYTVTVTRSATGCRNTRTSFLNNNIVLPVAFIDKNSDVTRCDVVDGELEAFVGSIGGTQAGYTFYWYNGIPTSSNQVVTTPNHISAPAGTGLYSGLAPGDYAVVAVDNVTSCQSAVVISTSTATIIRLVNFNIPISSTVQPATCGTNTGVIEAAADPGVPTTVGYTFEWYANGPTNGGTIDFFTNPPVFGGPILITNFQLSNVAAGLYSVVVTDNATGCKGLASFNLPFAGPPTLNEIVKNSTICPITVGNGQIDLEIIDDVGAPGTVDQTDYIVRIFQGSTQIGPDLIPGVGTGSFLVTNTLAPGNYELRVQETFTTNDCNVSEPIVIGSDAKDPVITLTSLSNNTTCAPLPGSADGAIQINVAKAATDLVLVQTYDITMVPANAAFPAVTGGAPGPYNANNIAANTYTFNVTSATTGCSTSQTHTVLNTPPLLEIANVTVTPAEYCIRANEAAARVVIANVNVNGAANTLNNYRFDWFTDIGLTTNVYSSNGDNTLTQGGEHFENGVNGVAAGTVYIGSYWAQATKLNGPGLGCKTGSFKADILDNTVRPAVSFATVDNSACDANFDGRITVTSTTASGLGMGANYNFVWTSDPDGPALAFTASNSPTNNTASPFSTVNTNLIGPGQYDIRVTNFITQCFSDATVNVSTSTIPMTIVSVNPKHVDVCLPTPVNGGGTITDVTINAITGQSANFTYTWDDEVSITAPNILANSPLLTLAGQDIGTYFVRGRRNAVVAPGTPGITGSGCLTAPVSFTVLDRRAAPILNLSSIPNTACDANFDGQISAIANSPKLIRTGTISVTGGLTAVTGTGTLFNSELAIGDLLWDDTGVLIGSIGAMGTNTTLTLAAPAPTTKTNIAFSASFGAGTSYNFAWTIPAGSSLGVVPPTRLANATGDATFTSVIATDRIGQGTYSLIVTNQANGCTLNSAVDVLNITVPMDVTSIKLTDLTVCTPLPADGSGQVTGVNVNNAVASTANFTFTWANNPLMTAPFTVDAPPVTHGGLIAGTYYVTAKRNAVASPITPGITGSGCITSPSTFTVIDLTVRPAVDVVSIPDIACNSALPGTGQLTATVAEIPGGSTTTGYLFEWFNGATATLPVIFTGNALTAVQDGTYTIQVTDNSAISNGCQTTVPVILRQETPILSSIVTTTPQTICTPGALLPNGSITVTTVDQQLMGTSTSFDMSNPLVAANFTFEWLDATGTPIATTPGIPTRPNQIAGIYQVRVTNNLGCPAPETTGIVIDQTAPPVLVLNQFINPAICILPETPGELRVTADGSFDVVNYGFTWYLGTGTTTAVAPANNTPFMQNVLYTDPLTYTVEVINNATQCRNLETYSLKIDTVLIHTLASATPLTNCGTPNGVLFASTGEGTASLYTYNWFSNGVPFTTPTAAPIGTYIVVASNPTFSFCPVVPDTTEVMDERIYPNVNLVQIAPNTNCDPIPANGAASASVNDTFIGYTFDWFEGAVSATPTFTGAEITLLRPTQYLVRATDNITQCEGTATITIENDPYVVPVPIITVINHRTNCVTPNGELQVDALSGINSNYTFAWYNGTAVKSSADAVDPIYSLLDGGDYTVTARDLATGCISLPVTEEVLVKLEYPDFEIRTTNTKCAESNGTAIYFPLNAVRVSSIEWNINNQIITGTTVLNASLDVGSYSVTSISFESCETTKDFVINPDINVYNAISKNDDGANDFFEIGCIEDFPTNIVRIFNRAGTLVYQADGYDNSTTYFNGVSNRGLSLLGTDLPDGTYFYIIDKRDGTEPRTGYLELLK